MLHFSMPYILCLVCASIISILTLFFTQSLVVTGLSTLPHIVIVWVYCVRMFELRKFQNAIRSFRCDVQYTNKHFPNAQFLRRLRFPIDLANIYHGLEVPGRKRAFRYAMKFELGHNDFIPNKNDMVKSRKMSVLDYLYPYRSI